MKKKTKIILICLATLVAACVVAYGGFYLYNLNAFNNRIAELNEFPDFADDGTEILFTFDLNRRD